MRDFRAHVRQHLPALNISAVREAKIVEELAVQLEELYVRLQQDGATEEAAWSEVERQVPSWQELARDLVASTPQGCLPPEAGHRSSRRRLLTFGLLHDTKIGLRVLWKERTFVTVSVLTLAVCVSVNVAIFTLVNSVLFHPLRVPEPDRIVLMASQFPKINPNVSINSSPPDYFDRLRSITALEEQAMYNFTGQTLEIAGVHERVAGMIATPSLFRLLRVSAVQGRLFDDSEGEIGHEAKVLLSYGLWQELYGDETAVGKEIRLSGRSYTVVGVLPRDFAFGRGQPRFWLPMAFTDQQKSDEGRFNNGPFSIGRLRKDATLEQVRQQLKALDGVILESLPALKPMLLNAGFQTTAEPLADIMVRDFKEPLYLLWAGATLVLLIGGVNLCNLSLVRGRVRAKEMTTQLALGAGWWRLFRQLLVQGLVLGVGAGIVGFLTGTALLSGLQAIGLSGLSGGITASADIPVVVFSFGVSVLCGLAIGLVSAVPLLGVHFGTVLHDGGRTKTSGRRARVARSGLIIAQIAFAFALLTGAGLLLVSFRNLLAVDPGFKREGLVTAFLSIPRTAYPTDSDVRVFTARMLESLRRIPGVSNAAATSTVPLTGNYSSGPILAEGYVPKAGESVISGIRMVITPGYFETMGIGLRRGRFYGAQDSDSNASVIVIDEKLARRFWPNEDPIGKRMFRPANAREIFVDSNTRWQTVIGVVEETRVRDLQQSDGLAGTYYLPYWMNPFRDIGLVARTEADAAATIRSVRAELAQIDAGIPIFDVRSMDERADLLLVPRKSALSLAVLFGSVALFLSAVGIYGVLGYLVAQRTREIGIRIALGSTAQGILKLIVREGLLLIGVGIACGLLGALALRRLLVTQLYGVGPSDPLVLSLVALLLGVIALIACWFPAHRASRVNPVTALNWE